MNIVKVREGKIRGQTRETKSGFKYCSFQGIPYAKPPVGELRFKDPQKIENWDGIKDALAEGSRCPQIDFTGEFGGTEDCLLLNVYTPVDFQPEQKNSVMVWIHGGGFFHGSGSCDSYGPDYLIEKGIVYVTFNYRFGIFGFLCLHSQEVPGNAGLKDQILALRWVKENIACFGGDPDNITVFGESAGAASLSYLTISPSAQGLFHRVIIQSGSSLCSWALQEDPLHYAEKIADKFKASDDDKKDILKFLQSLPYEDLTKHASKILNTKDSQKFLPIAFLPVVERNFHNIEYVINEHPVDIFKSKNYVALPTIAGCTSKEGTIMLGKIGFDMDKLHTLIENFENFLPSKILKDNTLAKKCAEELNKQYFDCKPIDFSQFNNIIDFLSDYSFCHPVDWNVRLLTEYAAAPVYYFKFCYRGNLSRDNELFQKYQLDGAAHSEECGYIFRKKHLEEIEPLPEDIITRDRLVSMWTNFAKTGNPTPQINENVTVLWKPATRTSLNYLDIGKDLTMDIEPNAKSLQLWMKFQDYAK